MNTEKTILCFGDSNTHGTMPMRDLSDSRRFGRDERWPGVLASALAPGFHVIEEGHPGRTTVHPDPLEGVHKNGLAVLPAILESHTPVDLVIVMLGTNDLKARFSVTPFDIALGTSNILDTISASDCGRNGKPPALLLVCPPPIIETGQLAEMFHGGEEKSGRLAAAFRQVAEERGIPFLNAGDHIGSDSEEGIHFDADAHHLLGTAIGEAVRTLLA